MDMYRTVADTASPFLVNDAHQTVWDGETRRSPRGDGVERRAAEGHVVAVMKRSDE
jgi:hypothetical protein